MNKWTAKKNRQMKINGEKKNRKCKTKIDFQTGPDKKRQIEK